MKGGENSFKAGFYGMGRHGREKGMGQKDSSVVKFYSQGDRERDDLTIGISSLSQLLAAGQTKGPSQERTTYSYHLAI